MKKQTGRLFVTKIWYSEQQKCLNLKEYILLFLFFKDFIYLLLRERRREGERERERNINVWEKHWLVASHTPNWGTGPEPRHVPWLGIKLVTFWFTDQHSIHWATPARTERAHLKFKWIGIKMPLLYKFDKSYFTYPSSFYHVLVINYLIIQVTKTEEMTGKDKKMTQLQVISASILLAIFSLSAISCLIKIKTIIDTGKQPGIMIPWSKWETNLSTHHIKSDTPHLFPNPTLKDPLCGVGSLSSIHFYNCSPSCPGYSITVE